MSLWEFDKLLQRIADDPRPQGLILSISEPVMGLADLQTLRGSLLRFRERGKEVIAYAQGYSLRTYYIASACNRIVLQPGGQVDTLGLHQRVTFFKNAFDTFGIALDVVAITPYKGAFDSLSRAEISPEARAQLDWLLDSRYDMLVDDIASGRDKTNDFVKAMIDGAPHLDSAALAATYVDAVIHEEELAAYLKVEHLVPWAAARKKLIIPAKKREAGKAIAILPIRGLMIPGESGEPPIALPIPLIGGERAGDRTIVQQIRQLQRQEDIVAVLLFIDSGGGAVVAAEAMTSALEELAKTKPVVAYMNDIAASGGYYVATAGQWIVAQPGTITGSIGVITAKLVTQGLLERARISSVDFKRGANADIYSDSNHFTDTQREQVQAQVKHSYQAFVERVAKARRMSREAVDEIGGGRVWTGDQAHTHALVDELGDVRSALRKARALAEVSEEAPIILWKGKQSPLPPLRSTQPNAWDGLMYAYENLRSLTGGQMLALMEYWLD